MEQIFLVYSSPSKKKPKQTKKQTFIAIMMLYKVKKAMANTAEGDTDFFDIVTALFKGDTSAH